MPKSYPKFRPVDPQPDFPAKEREILRYWYDYGIVEEYLGKNDKSSKKFKFIDGPITANGPMGVHHAWGRTYKDLWQRWYNMRGYRQRFQNGFDCQGLWVEVTVEKELGFKSKKDIEHYGIDKFVERCKDNVLRFSGIQTEQSKRLGMFMDWPNSYFTMSEENNYMIWSFLKKVHEDGYLYKGHDSVPWCPRCGTAISQHEILTEEYQELTHDSVFVKYPLRGKKGEFFLVWTTTPWTLPGNVAIAVNPEFTYVKALQNGEKLILAEDRLSVLEPSYKIIEKIPGKDLVGLGYLGAYDDLPAVKRQLGVYEHRVVSSKELVNAEEGTGLVHIAPGAGEEDFKLGKEEKLPVVELIDEAAHYIEGFGEELTGQSAKDNPNLILDDLAKRGLVYKILPYTHRYPVCWRCKTELVWRVVDEWYIRMDELRGKIGKSAKEANWRPDFGLDRELDWLKNMHDWLISKKRYWGLALPIWECEKCHTFQVIGSREELEEKAVKGWHKFAGHTPHRPWIDEVKILCPKCGEEVSRIKDVGNPWLDAGIVPFSTLKYRTDKSYFREWFPADFITESFPGQFKNWFYSLLTMSTVLEETTPFRTVLGYGTMVAEDGSEMHKSKGNLIVFDEAAEKIGSDVMRWIFTRHNPENNLPFGYHLADNVRKNFFLILWNVYRFFVDYAILEDYTPGTRVSENVLDRWIVSRLNETLAQTDASLEKYDPLRAGEGVESLVQDFSTWWLRRSRDRMGPWAKDKQDKAWAYDTFYFALTTLAKIMAPFTPFLAEEMYRNLTGERSVHLADWPKAGKIDEKLLEEMAQARAIVELAHGSRKEHQVKLRQPLAALTYSSPTKLSPEVEKVISDEVNVKSVLYHKGTKKEPLVEFDFELTYELKEEGEARDLIRQIQDARKALQLDRETRVTVTLPAVPSKWREEIERSTLAELMEGREFSVQEKKSGAKKGRKT